MKRIITKWKRSAVVSAAVLSVLLIALPQTGSAQQMSKQELKALLASTRSREDHQKLAAYYRQEADRLLAEAQKHDEMAEMYQKNPHPFTQKNPAAFGEQHCRHLADTYRKKTVKAQSIAALHEDMARQATQ